MMASLVFLGAQHSYAGFECRASFFTLCMLDSLDSSDDKDFPLEKAHQIICLWKEYK